MRPQTRAAIAASATALAVAGLVPAFVAPSAAVGTTTAHNVIYLLGDGMGRTHVTAGRERFYGAHGKLNMEKVPFIGHNSTYAVEKLSGQPGEADFKPNLVTDSASAATAWASGVKTYNAALGLDAKGNVKQTLMEMAHANGMATGNVSTAEITDATPAGQFSHVLARGCQGPNYTSSCQDTAITGSAVPTDGSDIRVVPVADQIAGNNVADVILGGGLGRFDAANQTTMTNNGYTVLGNMGDAGGAQTVATKTDLANFTGSKVIGLFNTGNMTVEKYKQDHTGTPQNEEPTVADMTSKAIDILKAKTVTNGGPGFYLQVEGALIDKRSHANDAAQTLEEIKAFDDAVKVALDFAKADGNTTVIVTADHECAGFNIIEKGTNTNAEDTTPPANNDTSGATTAKQNRANDSTLLRTAFPQVKDPNRSQGIYNDGTNALAANNFAPATFGTADQAATPGTLDAQARALDGTANGALWLSYLSGNHTGADVPVFGFGPDASAVEGSIDNTDLFKIVGGALGLMPSVVPAPSPTPTVTTTATVTASPSPAPTVTATATVTATPAPGKTNTATGLTGPSSVKARTVITWRATVAPTNATGAVRFYRNGSLVGTSALSGGIATRAFAVPAGTNTLYVVFIPTGSYNGSTSAKLTVKAS